MTNLVNFDAETLSSSLKGTQPAQVKSGCYVLLFWLSISIILHFSVTIFSELIAMQHC